MVQNPEPLHTRVHPATTGGETRSFRGRVWMMMLIGLLSLVWTVRGTVPVAACAAAPEVILAALENARRDLEANTALQARLEIELENLRQNSQTPSDILTDCTAYLARVRAMVTENRQLVKQLEKLHLQSTLPAVSSQAKKTQVLINTPLPEDRVLDDIDALDREFDESLAAFDDMLLEELKLIREQSSPKMNALAQDAADAAERLRKKGIDIDADGTETESGDASSQPPPTGEEKPTDASTETTGGASAPENDADTSPSPSDHVADGGEREPQKRSEHYDRSDDDIVARQLREAAEQETDPVMKEKLWKEYEAYKRSEG